MILIFVASGIIIVEAGKRYLTILPRSRHPGLHWETCMALTHLPMLERSKTFIDHDGFAILKDNCRIEVSRRRKEEVLMAQKFKPLGSYPETSKAIKVMLYANCRNAKGTKVKSEIDITNFSTSQKLSNTNGVLKKEK